MTRMAVALSSSRPPRAQYNGYVRCERGIYVRVSPSTGVRTWQVKIGSHPNRIVRTFGSLSDARTWRDDQYERRARERGLSKLTGRSDVAAAYASLRKAAAALELAKADLRGVPRVELERAQDLVYSAEDCVVDVLRGRH